MLIFLMHFPLKLSMFRINWKAYSNHVNSTGQTLYLNGNSVDIA